MDDVNDAIDRSAPVVRAGDRREIDTIAAVLAQAFADDPFTRFVVPAHRYRERLSAFFVMELVQQTHAPQVAVLDGSIAGAALWSPPGITSPGMSAVLRSAPHLVRTFGRSLPRSFRIFRTLDRARPTYPPHWYLETIGVATPGHGVGGALLTDGLARADAQRMPIYLESSSPANVPLYERYGFTATREIRLPDGGPSLTAMWRG